MRKPAQDVFPPDRALQLRMLLVTVLGLAFDAGLVAAMIAYVATGTGNDDRWIVPALLVASACAAAVAQARSLERRVIRDQPELLERCGRAIARVCLLADTAPPEIVVIGGDAPVSWASARPFRRARIYLTQMLVRESSDEELAAVLAHELSHLVNRDAIVMSLVAGPPTLIIRATQFVLRGRGFGWVVGMLFVPWLIVAPIPLAICRILSRYRELAADRGAAVLTGSPSAVSEAMMRLAGRLPLIPMRDLRAVGTSDLFHFMPSREYGATDIRRIWATHPRLKVRLRHLAALEAGLQRARPPHPLSG